MFEVCIYRKSCYWDKLVFKFDSIEEAQNFVTEAISHLVKKEDEKEDFIAQITYSAKYTINGKEEE